jgi:hypothetical protein
MIPRISLLDNIFISVVVQGRSDLLGRRSGVWPRSMVPCASSLGLLRVVLATRTRNF